MSGSGKARSERWRERRRSGLISVTIDVGPAHRRALEAMGLIEPGYDENRVAITWAVERYLDTAKAVQAIGDALYPAGASGGAPPENAAKQDVGGGAASAPNRDGVPC